MVRSGREGEWILSDQEMVQIDVGPGDVVWGVAERGYIYIMPNNDGKWKRVWDGLLSHVSYGGSGVWGTNPTGHVYYREGVTTSNPAGIGWRLLDGRHIALF
jgi:hypothetical protein